MIVHKIVLFLSLVVLGFVVAKCVDRQMKHPCLSYGEPQALTMWIGKSAVVSMVRHCERRL